MADYVLNLTARDGISGAVRNTRKEIEGLSSSAKKRLRDVPASFRAIMTSSDSTSKKIGKLKREMLVLQQAGQGETKLFNDMAAAARRLQADLDKVNAATRRVTAATKEASASRLTQMMGAGTAVTGVMGMLGGGDAAARILQVQSAMATLQGTMAAGNGAVLANPYIAVGAAVAGAGAAFVQYNKGMEETMRRTQQFTGLSGDALLSLRNGIKSVASTWDKDYNEVLATVDGLMAQYGITGEEALRVVRDGFVAGADDAGRMQDLISQYAGSFNDAGISARELVAIIGNTRSGIFSEEGMGAIQMAAKNIRDMSTSAAQSLDAIGLSSEELKAKLQSGELTTMEALQQISSKLKTLSPQSAEVGAVIQDIFGRKGAAAGYQLITALADVETNLDKVKTQTGEVGEATERLQQAHRDLEDALAAVFYTSEGGFETMATTLKAEVLEALAAVIRRFVELYNKCIIVRGGIAAIAFVFKSAWLIIKSVLKMLMDGLQALGTMIEGVLTIDLDKIKKGWQDGVKAQLETLSDGVEEYAKNIREARETLSEPLVMPKVVEEATTVKAGGGGGGGGTGTGTGAPGKGKGTRSPFRRDKDRAIAMPSASDRQLSGSMGFDTQEAVEGMQADLDAQYEIFKQHRERIRGIIDGMRGDADAGALAFIDLAEVLRDSMTSSTDKAVAGLSTIGGALQQLGADGPIAKVGAVMAAIGQAILGFATASAQAGSLGPFGWLAFVGAGLGTLASMVSTLKGFNAGGIVEGNSFHGDRMLARVNAGEMVLTRPQQGRLFDILDGGGGPMFGGGDVKFVLTGDQLVGVLNNYNRKMGKVR